LVEWDVLGEVLWRRWWWGRWRVSNAELEWELVSEWKSIAAVLDSAATGKSDLAERGWRQGYWIVQWQVECDDELAGDQDHGDDQQGWDSDRLE
jgi:hypothetical protein